MNNRRYSKFLAGFITSLILFSTFVTPAQAVPGKTTHVSAVSSYLNQRIEHGGRIIFISVTNGNTDIYVMNADGTESTRLTDNPQHDYFADWSQISGKIAFISTRDGNDEIYVMNPDGSNQIRLTDIFSEERYPSWSPDGTKIIFASNRDGNFEIYTMNSDGTDVARLTNNIAYDDFPSWSPDGSKIIFVSEGDGNPEIYSMNPDGSNQTRLTNDSSVGVSTGFNDVPVTHWAAPWIKQLAAEGITGGCGAGLYCPDNPVTRAQMAVFLVRTFNLP